MSNEYEDIEFVVRIKIAIRVKPGVELGEIASHIRQHVDVICKPEQPEDDGCQIRRAWISWCGLRPNH